MARHIRFDLSYDGTDFSGWQQQANARTVQGELEVALERCIGTRLSILGASRTDAGVHALGQVCSIIYDGNLPTKREKSFR
jgi:tRNA pseudouridine38-40 synthase